MRKILEERLENAKNDYGKTTREPQLELKGQIEAYQDCLNLLDQYNIITTPKEIKLSEIVSKLKEKPIFNKSKISICKHDNKIDIWEDYEFNDIVDEKCSGSSFLLSIDNKNKVDLICRDFTIDEHKWLYKLWIAGTEIVDDLKGDCNEKQRLSNRKTKTKRVYQRAKTNR